VEIGDDILVKGKIIGIEHNLLDYAVKVEVIGFLEGKETHNLKPCTKPVIFWIHRPKKYY
jgi:hypothetical protein